MIFFKKKKQNKNEIIIYAPCDGKVKTLKSVNDEVIADEILGKGLAIEPTSNEFYSPLAKGKITLLFRTLHAYNINYKDINVLVHIGINTVEITEKNVFSSNVKENDQVTLNSLIVNANLTKIKENKKEATTPILVSRDTIDKIHLEFTYLKQEGDFVKHNEPLYKITIL